MKKIYKNLVNLHVFPFTFLSLRKAQREKNPWATLDNA